MGFFDFLSKYTGPYKEMFLLLGMGLAFGGAVWGVLRAERKHIFELERQRLDIMGEARELRDELREEVNRLRASADELREEVERLRSRIADMEDELNRLRQRNGVLERAVRQHGLSV